jgi:serine/alanine adding enzyme
MKVELVERGEKWDEYVTLAAPDRSYHHWVWCEVIKETFGHQPYYLAATDQGEIRGVLPLIFIRSRIFGSSLVSIPFFSYGGVLVSGNEARVALLNRAAALSRELGASHVELRQGDECPMPWESTAPRVTMELHLPATAEEFWKKLSSGMRNKVRQGQKADFRVEWGGLSLVRKFYEVFATNMRNLGTPVYPMSFFENQVRRLGDRISILMLWEGEKAVAGSFLTAHSDTLELPWSASLPESRKKYSQVTMYWLLIQRAIAQGFKKIDLGRCIRGSGTYEFKRHWNPIERPLHWYYWLKEGSAIPNLRPDNPKFKVATSMWKQLPLALANGLGPRVVRSLP